MRPQILLTWGNVSHSFLLEIQRWPTYIILPASITVEYKRVKSTWNRSCLVSLSTFDDKVHLSCCDPTILPMFDANEQYFKLNLRPLQILVNRGQV